MLVVHIIKYMIALSRKIDALINQAGLASFHS